MKLASLKVISWYSMVSAVAAGAVLFAYLGVLASILGSALVVAVTYFILLSVGRTEEEDSPYLKISEQIAVVGIIIFLPLIMTKGLLIAMLVFLGFTYLALLFQTHDYRRLYVGLAVGFTAIITGAVESKSGFYLIYFLAYAVTISITLGYMYIEPLSSNRSQWNQFDQMRAAFLLIGLATLIYLVVPRFPAGNLGARPGSDHFYENDQWEQEAEQNRSGKDGTSPAESLLQDLADKFDTDGKKNKSPTEKSERSSNKQTSDEEFHYRGFDHEMDINNPDEEGDRFRNVIVAHVRADRPLYLRARIFDSFDGLSWHNSAQHLSKLRLSRGEIKLSPAKLNYSNVATEQYEVFVEHNLGAYIPAAAVPIKVNFPSTVIAMDAFGQLHSPSALKSGTAYAAESQRTVHKGRTFAETEFVDLPNFRQIPDDTDPRIADLANTITKSYDSQFAKAIALEQHLRNNYDYDFGSILRSQNRTPLSKFLFETKKGHCEYFASALAIMLRTQGIPSRLVTGFSATNQNPMTGYYDVYALDGHAWVEAYVDGIGWLELEPTAYYDGPSVDNETLSAEQINDYVERQLRLQEAIGETELSLEMILSAIWQASYLLVTWVGAYLKLVFIKIWPFIIGLGVILLSFWVLMPQILPIWRAFLIKRKLDSARAATSEEAISNHLQAIDALLHNAGYCRPAGQTIERMLSRVAELEVPLYANKISREFNQVYYSDNEIEVNLAHYRELFRALYSIGYSDLKQRIKGLK